MNGQAIARTTVVASVVVLILLFIYLNSLKIYLIWKRSQVFYLHFLKTDPLS